MIEESFLLSQIRVLEICFRNKIDYYGPKEIRERLAHIWFTLFAMVICLYESYDNWKKEEIKKHWIKKYNLNKAREKQESFEHCTYQHSAIGIES